MKKTTQMENTEIKIVIASIFSSKSQEKLFARSAEKFMFGKTKQSNIQKELCVDVEKKHL